MTTAPLKSSIYFVDDSGDARRIAVLGWLRVDLGSCAGPLGHWQAFLSELYADPYLDIRPGDSLHAVSLAAGRGRPVYGVRRPPGTSAKQPYREVIRRALAAISFMPGVAVGSAFRTGEPGIHYGQLKQDLYEAWTRRVNTAHAAAGSHAFIVFDGDGSEAGLRRAHRCLGEPRHVVGDPYLVPARRNTLLQAADQVAYSSFQQLTRQPHRRFMWEWLPELIPKVEGPLQL